MVFKAVCLWEIFHLLYSELIGQTQCLGNPEEADGF